MRTTISKMSTGAIAILAAGMLSATALAAPVTIDFDEDLPVYFGLETWQENGMSLTSNQPDGTLVDNNNLVRANLFAPGTGNDTQSLFFGANGAASTVTMTSDAPGTVFSLSSFEASSLYNAAGTMTVTGYFAGGGSTSQVIGLSSDLTAFNVAGMTGLSSVVFSFDGGAFFAPYDLDNINVDVVPIPAAVWLLMSGLGVLGAMRRRRIS